MMKLSPIEIDRGYVEDWGEVGKQWTGQQVQTFIKEQLQLLIKSYNQLINGEQGLSPVKHLTFDLDSSLLLNIDPDKSDFSNIDELRGYLEKAWNGEEMLNLTIRINDGTENRVFVVKGFYSYGSNYRIFGTVASEIDKIAEAYIVVKMGSMGYFQSDGFDQNTLFLLKEKLDRYPTITPDKANDNKTYGLKNGQLEEIAGENEFVWTGKEVTESEGSLFGDEVGDWEGPSI